MQIPGERELSIRLAEILSSWEGTRYWPNQCAKGAGVDCVRFVCSVMDELRGLSLPDPETLPQDSAMHNRAGAIATMKTIKQRYAPIAQVSDGSLEPCDILVTGPPGGGPGHGLIVGPERNQIWHATALRVQRCGLSFADGDYSKIFAVYRCGDRETWLNG